MFSVFSFKSTTPISIPLPFLDQFAFLQDGTIFVGMKLSLTSLLFAILLAGCGQSGPTQKEFDDLKDIVYRQSDSLADAYAEIKDLQQEQTYQYKDLSILVPKVRMHDSIVMKRQFQRDFWGKAGAFSRGIIGF